MRVVAVVVALAVMAGVASANDSPAALPPTLPPYEPPRAAVAPPAEPDTPPIDGSRVVGGIAIGSFIGVAGGAIGALVGVALTDGCGSDDDCEFRRIAIGAVPGVTLGAATGAWLVGTDRQQTSSYLAALGGAAIGVLGAYGGSQLTDDPAVEIAMFIVTPAIGATVGVTLTRRYKTVVIEPRVTATPDRATLGIAGSF